MINTFRVSISNKKRQWMTIYYLSEIDFIMITSTIICGARTSQAFIACQKNERG